MLWEDGTPLTAVEGMVRFDPFNPADPEQVPDVSSVGIIDSNGKFKLSTFEKRDGAREGEYKVKVFIIPHHDGRPVLHPDYEHYIRSPLGATVTADGDNDFEFRVDRNYKPKAR